MTEAPYPLPIAEVHLEVGGAWIIGPPFAFEVGDEVEIPYRGCRHGEVHPGCARAIVFSRRLEDDDGLAVARRPETLNEYEWSVIEAAR